MEAIDPNLVKAGTTDFSWIANGVKDGMQFAQNQATLDQQKELAKLRAGELSAQQEQNNTAKAMTIFSTVEKALGQTGATRSAYIKSAQQQAALFGIGNKIDPTFWSYVGDTKNDETSRANLATVDSLMSEGRFPEAWAALSQNRGLMDADSFSKTQTKIKEMQTIKEAADAKDAALGVSKMSAQAQVDNANTNKEKLANDKAQFTEEQKLNWFKAQTERIRANSDKSDKSIDKVSKMRAEAAKVQKAYGDVDASVANLKAQLKTANPFGDLATAEGFVRLAGAARASVSLVNQVSNAGSALDRLQLAAQGLVDKKYKFTPALRAEMMKNLTIIQKTRTQEEKEAYSPIYDASIGAGLKDAVRSGQILQPRVAKLFGEDVSNAPSQQNQYFSLSANAKQLMIQGLSEGHALSEFTSKIKGKIDPATLKEIAAEAQKLRKAK